MKISKVRSQQFMRMVLYIIQTFIPLTLWSGESHATLNNYMDNMSAPDSIDVVGLSFNTALVNNPFVMKVSSINFSETLNLGLAKLGRCNSSDLIGISVSAGGMNLTDQYLYLHFPIIREPGQYTFCWWRASNSSHKYDLSHQFSLISISGFRSPFPAVVQEGNDGFALRLFCEGCAGPEVKLAFMAPGASNCTRLYSNVMYIYDVPSHDGTTPLNCSELRQEGSYKLCWSPDNGTTFFDAGIDISVVHTAAASNINRLLPNQILRSQPSIIHVDGALCSPLSILRFVPLGQSSCANFTFSMDLRCSNVCSTHMPCGVLIIDNATAAGTYTLCYSTSGVQGPFVLQSSESAFLILESKRCSQSRCALGEYFGVLDTVDLKPVCRKCSAGYYCYNGSVSMIPCPPGTYAPNEGAASRSYCLTCPPATYSLAGSQSCLTCESGFSCVSGRRFRCSPGTFSANASVSCSICPSGRFCSTPDVEPRPCGPGYYAVYNQTLCFPCEPGSWSGYMSSECSLCSLGKFSGIASASCVDCPAGSFCLPDQSPTLCPAGTYSNLSFSACLTCPNGMVSDCNASSCILCASGTRGKSVIGCTLCERGYYSLTGYTPCTPCPAGFSCQTTVNVTPTPCKPGYVSFEASPYCVPCPRGFACPYSDQPLNRSECDLGTYSEGGQSSCSKCPAGFYCNSSSSVSKSSCPIGFSSLEGQSSCSS